MKRKLLAVIAAIAGVVGLTQLPASASWPYILSGETVVEAQAWIEFGSPHGTSGCNGSVLAMKSQLSSSPTDYFSGVYVYGNGGCTRTFSQVTYSDGIVRNRFTNHVYGQVSNILDYSSAVPQASTIPVVTSFLVQVCDTTGMRTIQWNGRGSVSTMISTVCNTYAPHVTDFDYMGMFITPLPSSYAGNSTKLEAEAATNSGATAVTWGSNFSGTGWVQGYASGTGYTQWTTPASTSPDRTLLFRMTNPFGSPTSQGQLWDLKRDGVTISSPTVPFTPSPGGDWTNWSKSVDIIKSYPVASSGSTHTVRMTRGAGGSGSNIDFMRDVTPFSYA